MKLAKHDGKEKKKVGLYFIIQDSVFISLELLVGFAGASDTLSEVSPLLTRPTLDFASSDTKFL